MLQLIQIISISTMAVYPLSATLYLCQYLYYAIYETHTFPSIIKCNIYPIDISYYIVYLHYNITDVSSQPTTITVGRTGDPTTTITVTPTIGQSVELQCTRTSAARRWYTTGSVVAATSNEISTSGGTTRILAFSSFTTSHAGTYSCVVQNNQMTTTYPVILTTG